MKERPISSMSLHMDEIVQNACQLSGHPASCLGMMSDSSSNSSSSSNLSHDLRIGRRQSPPFMLRGQPPRPQTTLRYMQSLDGSLTIPERTQLPDIKDVDDNESMAVDSVAGSVVHFVGRLRSNHDAILIGVNTIIRDNPRLISNGRQAKPIVLDTELQIPLDSQLMKNKVKPWIFCRSGLEDSPVKKELTQLGTEVFHVSVNSDTGYLNVEEVLKFLYDELDVQKLLVEGGVSVLESFIQAQLFDKLVVIMVPCFGVGRALFQNASQEMAVTVRDRLPRLANIRYDVLGCNLVMTAEPQLQ